MSKTPINKPIFLAHTSRYHSATHSTYPLFSYLRSMKNIMQHIVPRKQPQRKVQSSSEVFAFTYDANVDRTYKLTGKIGMQNVNGGWQCFYQMENATLYASPYLVATPRGYTKHYYAESERIASRIGGGGLADMAVMEQPEGAVIMNPLPQQYAQTGSNMPSEEEFREKARKVSRHANETARCLRAGLRTTALMEGLFTFRDSLDDEPDCYWYHPDHLGSSSWITYTDGDAVQHLHYLPFGENFVDQKSNSFDGVRYTFSAKEKDTETGYSYFGSRYYNSDLSIWLSVDPQSNKYPSTSPYAYCRNNPVVLIDPNGEFDTRAEARQYRKEHHTGGIIRKNSENDKFAGKYSIDNRRKNVSYTKPQYEESDASIPTIGRSSDGVVKSPIAHDSRTKREKFEDFERKVTQKAVPVCQGLAVSLPISSQVNDIMILSKGENMFGDKASESDKVWAKVDLATLGAGKFLRVAGKSGVPIFKKAADMIETIDYGLGIRSGLATTRDKLKNEKK